MTAPTLATVQEAIARQVVDAIPSLTGYWFAPGAIVPDCFIVSFGEDVVPYRGTFGAMSATNGAGTGWSVPVPFSLWIYVGAQVAEARDAQMGDYVDMTGELSIACALDADKTLGGVLDENGLTVDSFQRFGLTQWEADPSGAWYETAKINTRVVMNRSDA